MGNVEYAEKWGNNNDEQGVYLIVLPVKIMKATATDCNKKCGSSILGKKKNNFGDQKF